MNGIAYSSRKTITVLPPYGPGGRPFPRRSRLRVQEDIRERVYSMLKEQADADHSVWWHAHPYRVTVRDTVGTPGRYVYSVHKGTGEGGKPAAKFQ